MLDASACKYDAANAERLVEALAEGEKESPMPQREAISRMALIALAVIFLTGIGFLVWATVVALVLRL